MVLLPHPYNHPIRVAERIAVLDIVSNGRVDFGTGRSSTALEMDGFELKPEDTRPMWDEALRMIPQMWLNETFSWDGKYYHIPPRQVVPKPIQKPHPPIWMAANQPSSFALAGQLGIGALGFVLGNPAELEGRIQAYRENIKNAQPVGGSINNQVAALTFVHCQEDNKKALEIGGDGVNWYTTVGRRLVAEFREAYGTRVESYRHFTTEFEKESGYTGELSIEDQVKNGALCIGDPDTCIKVAKKYQEVGVDQLMCLMQMGHVPHQKVMNSIELFGKYVIPYFKNT